MGFTRLSALYRRHFRDHRRERMFLASLSFFVTFGVTRYVTQAFRNREDPLQVTIGGVHVHHLVWGIVLLIVVGYMWLIQVGTEGNGRAIRMGRITALLYGVGAALTLDEFALWLNLRDVYWERQGRASVDIALMYGALVSAGLWGGPFFRAVGRQAPRILGWSMKLRPRRRPPIELDAPTLVEEIVQPTVPTTGTRPDAPR
jgi:hypothetical protein